MTTVKVDIRYIVEGRHSRTDVWYQFGTFGSLDNAILEKEDCVGEHREEGTFLDFRIVQRSTTTTTIKESEIVG